jgi:HEPN domain-containing protein
LARNPQERVQWSIQKSQEYLDSAIENIKAKRTYPAAEEIFRSVESSLTGLLYSIGIIKIEYPRYGEGDLKGRQALQSLIRDNLIRQGIITNEEYQTYRRLVTELHQRSYISGEIFEENEIQGYSEFAENLLVKTRATLSE